MLSCIGRKTSYWLIKYIYMDQINTTDAVAADEVVTPVVEETPAPTEETPAE